MSQFEDQIRFPCRNCNEGFQKSFVNIGSYWRIPRPQPPLVHPRASLLFFSSRIWIYQAGTTYFGQHVITYRYLLSKVPNRCSSHAKETKYLPSIYVRSGRPWLWSHVRFEIQHGTGKATSPVTVRSLVFSLANDESSEIPGLMDLKRRVIALDSSVPRFSIARSCEDLGNAEEQLMGVESEENKGNLEQRRSGGVKLLSAAISYDAYRYFSIRWGWVGLQYDHYCDIFLFTI